MDFSLKAFLAVSGQLCDPVQSHPQYEAFLFCHVSFPLVAGCRHGAPCPREYLNPVLLQRQISGGMSEAMTVATLVCLWLADALP
ncbi:hypothetical protein GCM10023116_08630 [Kistimonas scapharcae]|uniref:Uncharacterized protein n=1 Tax=Kistimonas scapharcae TaxID=1036133 RepID=A0ABP8UXX6_9GAMM